MKNNIILICFFAALVVVGCQRDDSYEAPNSFSDVGWIMSDVDGPLDAFVGNYITFTDASQGYLSHRWEIGPGNFYLAHPLSNRDSIATLDSKITGTGVTDDNTVSVLFKESGLQSVRLYNVFQDSVGFRGVPDVDPGHHNESMSAEFIDGQWVIDKTFFVDVYAQIRPKVQIDHANGSVTWETPEIPEPGNGITITTAAASITNVITVEAGDAVDFTDITEIGRPDTVAWRIINAEDLEGNNVSFNNGSPIGNTTELNYTFSSLGDYYIAIRESREAEGIPTGFTNVVLPYRFSVVPSSKPFELLGDVVEMEDETISLAFTGEFQDITGQEDHFTVNVNGTPFAIESVTTNGTSLDIKLVDPIYRPDVITVSYDGNGDFKSTDERSPVAFIDVPVVMHNVNLIEQVGLINFDDSWFEAQSSGRFEFSTEQFVSGPTSAKHTIGPGALAGMRVNPDPAIVTDPTKDYIVSFKMYIDPASTAMPNRIAIFDIPRWAGLGYAFTGSEPLGEWIDVQITLTASGNSAITGILFRTDATATTDAIIYYDDFHFVEAEVRP